MERKEGREQARDENRKKGGEILLVAQRKTKRQRETCR